jgi:tight adherence protein C
LIICLDAGLSIEVALRRIARELAPSAPVLAEELTIMITDLSLLSERRQAYLSLAQRVDLPSVKSVVIALIQAEKQGASIANSLRVIAASNRQSRIALAEEKAAALGPKMTIPMIVFFLPVIFVIIIAPIVLTAEF